MDIATKARQLRRQSTDAERKLWSIVRNRRLAGYKFRRQVPIDSYIVDFVCFDKKLVIEIDGGQHQTQTAYDDYRTQRLQSVGFRVIRFWNNQVLSEADGVAQVIETALGVPVSPSP